MNKIINFKQLEGLTGGDSDFCKALLTGFLKEVGGEWDNCLESLKQKDYKKARFEIHKLSGSCSAVFAIDLVKNLSSVEESLINNSFENEEFSFMLDKIDDAITRQLREEIERYIQT